MTFQGLTDRLKVMFGKQRELFVLRIWSCYVTILGKVKYIAIGIITNISVSLMVRRSAKMSTDCSQVLSGSPRPFPHAVTSLIVIESRFNVRKISGRQLWFVLIF